MQRSGLLVGTITAFRMPESIAGTPTALANELTALFAGQQADPKQVDLIEIARRLRAGA